MPALAMTDHGNVFGAYDFATQAKAAGVKPIIGMEAYVTPGTSRFDRTRVRWAEGGEADVSGGGAYTHMTLLATDETGLHNLFKLASLASHGGLLLQAPDRPGAPRPARRGPDRARPAARAARRRPGCGSATTTKARAVGRGAAGHLRAGPVLPRADGPRHRDRAPAAATACSGCATTSRCRCWPPTTCTTPTSEDADAHEVLLCVQSGKTMADPNRFKFDGVGLLPQVPGGDAPGLAGPAGGVRQHAAGRRAVSATATFTDGDLMPRFPVPAGETEESLAGRRGRARAGPAVPRRRRRTPTASRRSTSSASSARWASRATSWSSPTCAGTPRSPASGSARAAGRPPAPWSRTRWASPSSTRSSTAAVRALPQPRAGVDARHRPGLRRAPARRHDPLRDGEVRRGAGRADHHVRHDQGQAGDQGLGPGAGLPVLHRATGSPRRCRRR